MLHIPQLITGNMTRSGLRVTSRVRNHLDFALRVILNNSHVTLFGANQHNHSLNTKQLIRHSLHSAQNFHEYYMLWCILYIVWQEPSQWLVDNNNTTRSEPIRPSPAPSIPHEPAQSRLSPTAGVHSNDLLLPPVPARKVSPRPSPNSSPVVSRLAHCP